MSPPQLSGSNSTDTIWVHLCSSVALKLFLLFLAAAPTYRSPDLAVEAVVTQTRTEFRTTAGRLLLTRDDASHGLAHAAWTPDSQFFVASTEALDGHQPWAHPIWIYSRAKNRILDLSALGATVTADFTLRSPDILQTKILNCEQMLIIRLHQLFAKGRLPRPLCPAD